MFLIGVSPVMFYTGVSPVRRTPVIVDDDKIIFFGGTQLVTFPIGA